jgi:L-fuconolactonase
MIDAHQHFWKFNPVRDAWITPEMSVIRRDFLPQDLQPILNKLHIDGCVAVQADQAIEETTFLLSLADEFDFIKAVVGWIDLRSSGLREKLEQYSAYRKLKGFRHIVQAEPKGFMNDASFIHGVNLLGEFGYTYDLLIKPHQMEEALGFLQKTRGTKIVLDHMAKPSISTGEKTRWELQLAAIATFQNVYCKVSGMVTEANWKQWREEDFFPYMDEAFECFGTRRLMYGSDWPVCLLAASYEQQLEIVETYLQQFTADEKNNLMHENACRFYNIEMNGLTATR